MALEAIARQTGLLFDETSLRWFRGYVESDTLGAALDDVLEEFGTGVHVVAHTPVSTIESRHDGRLLVVDLERPATEVVSRVERRWRSVPAMEGQSGRSPGAVLTKWGPTASPRPPLYIYQNARLGRRCGSVVEAEIALTALLRSP